nr:hypothetical protein CFP56_56459 [Quercus suber]
MHKQCAYSRRLPDSRNGREREREGSVAAENEMILRRGVISSGYISTPASPARKLEGSGKWDSSKVARTGTIDDRELPRRASSTSPSSLLGAC